MIRTVLSGSASGRPRHGVAAIVDIDAVAVPVRERFGSSEWSVTPAPHDAAFEGET